MSVAADDSETPKRKRRVFAPVLLVCGVTVILIAAGKLVVPFCIETIFPASPAPPAPARPLSGMMYHLEDPDSTIRLETVQSLVRLNPGNPHVFRRLSALLVTDENPSVRLKVAESLAASQPFPEMLPNLIHGLNDKDPQVRRTVLLAIDNFASDAVSAIPAIQMMVDNEAEDPKVRTEAAKVLEEISGNN